MKVYIAGPMSGHDDFNFPAFYAAADNWREAGWEVLNPAELDGGDTSQTWLWYMKRDLPALLDCDAIAMLEGWENSRGARLEHAVALNAGLRVFDARHPARLPVTDHQYREGTNVCCDQPDYMHYEYWKAESAILAGVHQ